MAEQWDQLRFRGVDDVLEIVRWGIRHRDVKEIRILPAVVHVRRASKPSEDLDPQAATGDYPGLPAITDLLPARLPVEDVSLKISGHNIEWELVRGKTLRDAFFLALLSMHRRVVQPTHVISGDPRRMFAALGRGLEDVANIQTHHWFAGLEVIALDRFDGDTHFLCGGPRTHGSVADIETVIRIEEGA